MCLCPGWGAAFLGVHVLACIAIACVMAVLTQLPSHDAGSTLQENPNFELAAKCSCAYILLSGEYCCRSLPPCLAPHTHLLHSMLGVLEWLLLGLAVVAAIGLVRVPLVRGHLLNWSGGVRGAFLVASPAAAVAFLLSPPAWCRCVASGVLEACWVAASRGLVIAQQPTDLGPVWMALLLSVAAMCCLLSPALRVDAVCYWFWVLSSCLAAARRLLASCLRAAGGLGYICVEPVCILWLAATECWEAGHQQWGEWRGHSPPWAPSARRHRAAGPVEAWVDRVVAAAASWVQRHLWAVAMRVCGLLHPIAMRHPLKLLLCFLACKQGAWLLVSSAPSPLQCVCCVFGLVQLAAIATFFSFPKRMPTLFFILGAFLSIFTSWAAFAPVRPLLQLAPPAVAIPHPVLVYKHPHLTIRQLSFIPLQSPQIRPPPSIPTISSPFLIKAAFPSQRTCAPLPPAIPCLVPAPPAWFTQARLLILVLLLHLVPVLSFWLACAQHCFELRVWPRVVRWYHLQYMCWMVQRIRCRLLFRQSVHWFMRPFLPVFLRETRSEVIHRLHAQGIFLKSAARKHLVFPARGATELIRRKNPAVVGGVRTKLLVVATVLLSSLVTAAAGGVAAGLPGIAAAALAFVCSDVTQLNLAFLAVNDPGMAVVRAWRAAREETDKSNLAARLASVKSLAGVADYRPDGALAPDPDPTTARYTKDPVGQWTLGNHPGFTKFHHEQLHQLLLDNRSCFAYSLKDLSGYLGAKFVIKLTHDNPIKQKQRNHAPLEKGIMDEKCTELYGAHMLGPAPLDCKYASNATMPAKKDADGNWTDFRFCIDFRDINEATVADLYGMHLAADLFQAAGGAKFFSKIDMRAAFHQFEMDEASQAICSFWWRNQLFSFRRLCFGLRNASCWAQRQLDLQIGKANLRGCVVSFVDDLLVYSNTAEEHLEHIRQVFDMLRSCGLKAHPAKTLLACESVEFLGFDIGPNGITPHAAKIAAVKALPVPTNVAELRSVLGFLGYYRVFVPGYSATAAPLNDLLKKDAVWDWQQHHQSAYEQIKEQMCREGAAVKPLDPDRPLVVYADWSNLGIGAVLAQKDDDGNEYMVACISRSLNKHERAYSSWEGEALAGVWAIKSFREYLFGRRFTLVSDHQPLKWLMQSPNLTGKHIRWALAMQDYDFTIEHRPGSQSQNVDVPSRFPMARTFDPTGACLDPDFQPSVPLSPAGARPDGLPGGAKSVQDGPAALHAVLSGVDSPAACSQPRCDLTALTAAHTHQHSCCALHAAMEESDSFLDSFPASGRELLHGNAGQLSDVMCHPVRERCEVAAGETVHLRSSAADLVRAAAGQLRYAQRESPQQLEASGPTDSFGVRTAVTKLCTQRVGGHVASSGNAGGIVVYEPFGGIASGLEGLLAIGVRVKRYLYSDISPAARAVAQFRLVELHYKYPHLLPLNAFAHAFDSLPADVKQVDTAALIAAGAREGDQWLVIAGWPCEDLSAAGNGKGLRGSRSGLFYDTLRIVGALQQLQLKQPPGYILENTHMQSENNHAYVRQSAFPAICAALGQPVALDAARCGAYAHRLRNFWSNLACPRAVQTVCDLVEREPDRYVQHVLDHGRVAPLATRPQQSPWYPCNAVRGGLLEALPTLVAYVGSRAFRVRGGVPGKGMLVDEGAKPGGGQHVEPNPDERERIMGYATGCTAAPGVTAEQRHELMGKAMDRHAVTRLFSVYNALSNCHWDFEGVACLADVRRQPAPHRLLPAVSRHVLQQHCSYGLGRLESRGWRVGQPLGSETAGGLPWPLDTAGLIKGAGLGYTGGAAVHQAASHSGAGPRLSLYGEVDRCRLPVIPESIGVQFGLERGSWEALGEPRHVAAARDDMWPATGSLQKAALAQRGVAHRCKQAVSRRFIAADATDHERLTLHAALAVEAEVVEHLGGVVVDILEDVNVLRYLRENGAPPGAFTGPERARVKRRAKQYELNGDTVVRMMADGTRRIVPPLTSRVDLIQQTHAKTGHWGVRRTKALLLSSYWWQGLERDVAKVLANCEICGQVKATFNVADPQLHPLPIGGMGHTWGVDLCGPFHLSTRGNQYVMVCIEHFTKHVELIAIPDKEAETTAYAFLANVLGRFGACAEVVTDRGSEFLGAFHQLLEESMIDHRQTSAQNPQADGLAERCVQSLKMALSKSVLQNSTLHTWDEQLQWIALGYRASKQQSSGFSPYRLLYGAEPCIPPAVKDRYRPGLALVFDTPEHQQHAADYVLMRSQLLQQNCSIAMTNLRSAQQRDTLRYRQVRSGLYRPSLFKFHVGDYVYVRRQNVSNTLMSTARPGIFRCLEVRESGVLVLQGKCGSTMEVNQRNCAPCHLMNVDGRIDHSLRVPGADEPCVVCDSPDDESIMLMCDGCGKGYHTYCLMPPLAAVPDAIVWICPQCEQAGVQLQPLLEQRIAADAAVQRPSQAMLFPNPAQRRADASAAELDGKPVMFQHKGAWVKGTLEYIPRAQRVPAWALRPIRVRGMRGNKQWHTEAAARKLLAAGAGQLLAAALTLQPARPLLGFVAATEPQPGASGAWVEGDLGGWVAADYRTVEGCELAGELLFPGGLRDGEGRELMEALAGAKQRLHKGWFQAEVLASSMDMLLQAVDLRSCVRMCCDCQPFGSAEPLVAAIKQRYGKVLVVHGEVGPGAVLSPDAYKSSSKQSQWDWVFLYVAPGMEDVALAVAMRGALTGVALLCPPTFMTSGPAYRQRLLEGCMQDERLAVVSQPGQQYIWVCVFATAGHLNSMCSRPRVGAFCRASLVDQWGESVE